MEVLEASELSSALIYSMKATFIFLPTCNHFPPWAKVTQGVRCEAEQHFEEVTLC